MVNPTDIITIIVVIGAAVYTTMKYLDKKRADPSTVFDLTYAIALVSAIYGAGEIAQRLELQLTTFDIITAFAIGFSFSAGASVLNTKIPITLQASISKPTQTLVLPTSDLIPEAVELQAVPPKN